jgi:CBS domain-containing protein
MIEKTVGNVIKAKDLQELITVPAAAKVSDAVALMSRKGVGAVVVGNAGGPVEGIFTERDLMRRVVDEGRDAKSTPITAVMSREVRRVPPTATVEDALRLMVVHGYRHLLVEEGAKVQGLISIRDLMAWMILPDEGVAYEGRVGVIKARTEHAVGSIQGMKPA